ncbi:MAG: endonuclease/exonuclease/phosphatase family protein [Bacteroidota bacterium]
MRFILLSLLFLISASLLAQSNRIVLDEAYEDWANISPLISDSLGDAGSSNIDFGKLWVSNDDEFIFFRIEVGAEINLQDDNEIRLYIDTDNNASTGLSSGGIGAELVYHFGGRRGSFYLNGSPVNIGHADIFLVSSPTVTSDQFEIAISRNAQIQGQNLFKGNELKLLLTNDITGADQIPDASGGIPYSFNSQSPDPLPPYTIEKTDPTHLRVLSYNVLRDDLFALDKEVNYTRILQAIEPDLIGFQEIYQNGSAQTASKVASMLSMSPAQWYHAKVDPDIVALSQYPILASYDIAPGGNGAFLIDVDSLEILFIVAHPPCCSNNSGRQAEIDGIMAFIRDAKNGSGPISLANNSPIIITGDMNLVGLNRQVETLLTGNISDQATYGNDFDPDWDSSPLEDVKPPITDLPLSMTWYNEGSSFSPGRLDYIVYSASVISLENSYTLFTPALSQADLSSYNLQANDVVRASDHLPLVADFQLGNSTSIRPGSGNIFKLKISPNPVESSAQISYYLPKSSHIQLKIFDLMGKEVVSFLDKEVGIGEYSTELKKGSLAAGSYYCQLITDYGIAVEKLLISD